MHLFSSGRMMDFYVQYLEPTSHRYSMFPVKGCPAVGIMFLFPLNPLNEMSIEYLDDLRVFSS